MNYQPINFVVALKEVWEVDVDKMSDEYGEEYSKIGVVELNGHSVFELGMHYGSADDVLDAFADRLQEVLNG